MSTNPFRRSSLKGFDGTGGVGSNIAPSSSNIPRLDVDATTPLTVNTKVPTSTQKHVNFASPPAIPISPVSYPPSPESTRFSPAFQNARPILPSPTNYSGALQNDPFRAEAKTDDDDGEIEQALVNAKINTALAAPTLETTKEDAVRNTLSRFASAPKRSPAVTGNNARPPHSSPPQKQTMDVDAFKRLLLTGDTGQPSQKLQAPPVLSTVAGDSSSGTDTASISQRSLFDPPSAADLSSESSDDVEMADTYAMRQAAATSSDTVETRKRPPPPKPRHGKLVDESAIKEGATNTALPPTMPSQDVTESFPTPNVLKKAPMPPLARRSHNSFNARPPSSRTSSSSDITASVNTTDTNFKAPPPPRARRPNTTVERRPSGDLPPTREEPDSADDPDLQSRKVPDTRPPFPPSRNSSKRLSTSLSSPPPVPPPRRGRGSSRSSIESQRPSISYIFNNENVGNSNADYGQIETESSTSLANSNASDILADLAALQREVDEARSKGTK